MQCGSTRPMHVAALAFLAPLASKHQTLPEQQKLGSSRAGRPAAGWFVRPHASSTAGSAADQRSSSRVASPPSWSRNTGWLYRSNRQLQPSSPRCVVVIFPLRIAVLVYPITSVPAMAHEVHEFLLGRNPPDHELYVFQIRLYRDHGWLRPAAISRSLVRLWPGFGVGGYEMRVVIQWENRHANVIWLISAASSHDANEP